MRQKKLLSLLLAVCMLLALFPSAALADGEAAEPAEPGLAQDSGSAADAPEDAFQESGRRNGNGYPLRSRGSR